MSTKVLYAIVFSMAIAAIPMFAMSSELTSGPSCCIKRAYCCQTHSSCCRGQTELDRVAE